MHLYQMISLFFIVVIGFAFAHLTYLQYKENHITKVQEWMFKYKLLLQTKMRRYFNIVPITPSNSDMFLNVIHVNLSNSIEDSYKEGIKEIDISMDKLNQRLYVLPIVYFILLLGYVGVFHPTFTPYSLVLISIIFISDYILLDKVQYDSTKEVNILYELMDIRNNTNYLTQLKHYSMHLEVLNRLKKERDDGTITYNENQISMISNHPFDSLMRENLSRIKEKLKVLTIYHMVKAILVTVALIHLGV